MKDWQKLALAAGAGLIGVAITAEMDPKTRSEILTSFIKKANDMLDKKIGRCAR